jgi:hypothetical protein
MAISAEEQIGVSLTQESPMPRSKSCESGMAGTTWKSGQAAKPAPVSPAGGGAQRPGHLGQEHARPSARTVRRQVPHERVPDVSDPRRQRQRRRARSWRLPRTRPHRTAGCARVHAAAMRATARAPRNCLEGGRVHGCPRGHRRSIARGPPRIDRCATHCGPDRRLTRRIPRRPDWGVVQRQDAGLWILAV